jgi:GTP-binding protein EngB required for normal cell division
VSAVVETLRRVSGRSSDLVERLAGLEQAVQAADGRLDPDLVASAATVVNRAGARLKLSGEHTVVALAGATGSGKSSLFNVLTGLDLAAVGVRRPTTAWALACAWGPDGAGELLDWLGIPKRHQLNRMSLLDGQKRDRELSGLVLLDLPDHDSVEVAHHLEVERLVQLADVLVWVLDPQKYADAAIHHRFLRPLASHSEVMLVVLNHIDALAPDRVESALADLRRLLVLDGLGDVPLLTTSAARGDGLPELRSAIADRVAQKRFARERLAADVKVAATRMTEQTGSASPGDIGPAARGELVDACADAAGVPVVVNAIESASVLRARQATGWPVTKWLSRFRPDPLRRLHLDGLTGSSAAGTGKAALGSALTTARTSVPPPTSVQRARVEGAVRGVADSVTAQMTPPWAAAVRTASTSRLGDFTDALDSSVAGTDLGVTKDPAWWRGVRVLQWLLFFIAVVGALWLAALAFFAYLRLPEPGNVDWHGFPLPTLLLIGGVLAGLLVAAISRTAARVSARRRAARARGRLRGGIERVCEEFVIAPMQRELDAYATCRDGLTAALHR